MGEALKIQPQRPTPLPRAPSRRQRPFKHTSKLLNFEDTTRTSLRNSLGERFTITVEKMFPDAHDIELKSKDREAGELIIDISLRASREKNKVYVSSITCQSSDTSPDQAYSKPSRENRGFGVVRLAIHFAKKLAKEHGISRITIMPYCRALQAHYVSSGFRIEEPSDTIKKSELVMHLKN